MQNNQEAGYILRTIKLQAGHSVRVSDFHRSWLNVAEHGLSAGLWMLTTGTTGAKEGQIF